MREIKAAVVIETTLRLSLREAVNGGLQDSVGALVARSVNSLDHRVAVEFAGLVVAAKEDSGQRIIACVALRFHACSRAQGTALYGGSFVDLQHLRSRDTSTQ